jgi:hypothetical protein
MLQASVSNVSSVFSEICYKCFYLNVAYVLHIYFVSVFIRMLHMFCIGFSSVLGVFASVPYVCFKCFIFLHDAKVSYGCFKSTSDVVHVAM